MEEDSTWKSSSYRQSVVNEINQYVTNIRPKKCAEEIEKHVFSKARNKDEYLSFIARLIIHAREIDQNNANDANDSVKKVIDSLKNLQIE